MYKTTIASTVKLFLVDIST